MLFSSSARIPPRLLVWRSYYYRAVQQGSSPTIPRGVNPTTTTTTTSTRSQCTEASATTANKPSVSPVTRPFSLETGSAVFAKRPSRPFPPPFLSWPSASFSDPLTTYNHSRDRRSQGRQRSLVVDGQYIKGTTNGDDAVIVHGGNFLAVNDGVGAWATKERGHAGLWSRLIAHFWAVEVDKATRSDSSVGSGTSPASSETQTQTQTREESELHPVRYLQTAFEQTKIALSAHDPAIPTATATASTLSSTEIYGTTTACSALLHHRSSRTQPLIYATNLGDCAVVVIRPATGQIVYHSTEQWHWFDCPRQLGTNSPDVPTANAVVDRVDIEVGDVVCVVSDGVSDNLWQHEVCDCVCRALEEWAETEAGPEKGRKDTSSPTIENNDNDDDDDDDDDDNNNNNHDNSIVSSSSSSSSSTPKMNFVAHQLMTAARRVAQDPFAESPFMDRAVDEGLPMEGGKLDDISVLVGLCRRMG